MYCMNHHFIKLLIIISLLGYTSLELNGQAPCYKEFLENATAATKRFDYINAIKQLEAVKACADAPAQLNVDSLITDVNDRHIAYLNQLNNELKIQETEARELAKKNLQTKMSYIVNDLQSKRQYSDIVLLSLKVNAESLASKKFVRDSMLGKINVNQALVRTDITKISKESKILVHAAISPSGRFLSCLNFDQSLLLKDQIKDTSYHFKNVLSTAFSPDGNYLAILNATKIRLIEMSSGESTVIPFEGAFDFIDFSNTGKYIVVKQQEYGESAFYSPSDQSRVLILNLAGKEIYDGATTSYIIGKVEFSNHDNRVLIAYRSKRENRNTRNLRFKPPPQNILFIEVSLQGKPKASRSKQKEGNFHANAICYSPSNDFLISAKNYNYGFSGTYTRSNLISFRDQRSNFLAEFTIDDFSNAFQILPIRIYKAPEKLIRPMPLSELDGLGNSLRTQLYKKHSDTTAQNGLVFLSPTEFNVYNLSSNFSFIQKGELIDLSLNGYFKTISQLGHSNYLIAISNDDKILSLWDIGGGLESTGICRNKILACTITENGIYVIDASGMLSTWKLKDISTVFQEDFLKDKSFPMTDYEVNYYISSSE